MVTDSSIKLPADLVKFALGFAAFLWLLAWSFMPPSATELAAHSGELNHEFSTDHRGRQRVQHYLKVHNGSSLRVALHIAHRPDRRSLESLKSRHVQLLVAPSAIGYPRIYDLSVDGERILKYEAAATIDRNRSLLLAAAAAVVTALGFFLLARLSDAVNQMSRAGWQNRISMSRNTSRDR
jgi:hypothetical protein